MEKSIVERVYEAFEGYAVKRYIDAICGYDTHPYKFLLFGKNNERNDDEHIRIYFDSKNVIKLDISLEGGITYRNVLEGKLGEASSFIRIFYYFHELVNPHTVKKPVKN